MNSWMYPTDLPAARPPLVLDLFLLGRVELQAVEVLQRVLADELMRSNQHRGVLLLCELPPCRSRGTARLELSEQIGSTEVTVISRPGGIIEHGPGQLLISPIFSLDQMELAPLRYRDALELMTAQLCERAGVPEVEIVAGCGINSRVGLVARTVASIRGQLSQFGMVLNVGPTYALDPTQRCSSMTAAAMRPCDLGSVKGEFVELLKTWLDGPQVNLYTRHPLLNRKTR